MDKKLKFAIYGCGVISKTHATAIKELHGAVLYGCADIVPSAAEAFSKTYGTKF